MEIKNINIKNYKYQPKTKFFFIRSAVLNVTKAIF